MPFQKGNTLWQRKESRKGCISNRRKDIAWQENEHGCWICTSHKPNASSYPCHRAEGKATKLSRTMYKLNKGDIPSGMCVCHTCDNPMCINPDHLFLGSHIDNIADKVQKGRQSRLCGESNPIAKLTEEQVREIKSATGRVSRKLARVYGVSEGLIGQIRSGRAWKHIV